MSLFFFYIATMSLLYFYIATMHIHLVFIIIIIWGASLAHHGKCLAHNSRVGSLNPTPGTWCVTLSKWLYPSYYSHAPTHYVYCTINQTLQTLLKIYIANEPPLFEHKIIPPIRHPTISYYALFISDVLSAIYITDATPHLYNQWAKL